jgi:ADP-heptose:LPS heptosyltransferase
VSIKVGIIRTSSIGDVVLATACLDYLRSFIPEECILWVGRQPTLDLLQLAWPKVQTLELKSHPTSLDFDKVKKCLANCELVVDLQNNFLSRRLTSSLQDRSRTIITAKKMKLFRVGLVMEAFFRGRLQQLPTKRRTVQKFQYRMMLDAVEFGLRARGIINPTDKSSGRPRLDVAGEKVLENILWRDVDFGSWIAIAPGASHQTKRAPISIFIDTLTRMAQLLPDERVCPGLVYLGSNEDRQIANEMMDGFQWSGRSLNLAGKLTLDQTAVVLSKSKVLLSNDSGLAHIAEAVGVPVAVFFGPTVESFGFAPWRAQSRAHSSPIGCRPCSRHGRKPCRFKDQLCFQTIDTRAVARQLFGLVGGDP